MLRLKFHYSLMLLNMHSGRHVPASTGPKASYWLLLLLLLGRIKQLEAPRMTPPSICHSSDTWMPDSSSTPTAGTLSVGVAMVVIEGHPVDPNARLTKLGAAITSSYDVRVALASTRSRGHLLWQPIALVYLPTAKLTWHLPDSMYTDSEWFLFTEMVSLIYQSVWRVVAESGYIVEVCILASTNSLHTWTVSWPSALIDRPKFNWRRVIRHPRVNSDL